MSTQPESHSSVQQTSSTLQTQALQVESSQLPCPGRVLVLQQLLFGFGVRVGAGVTVGVSVGGGGGHPQTASQLVAAVIAH